MKLQLALKMGLVFLCIIGFSFNSHSTALGNSCVTLFSETELVVESIPESLHWETLKLPDEQTVANKITGFLNRLFFPMMDLFGRMVEATTKAKVTAELKALNENSPIIKTGFEETLPSAVMDTKTSETNTNSRKTSRTVKVHGYSQGKVVENSQQAIDIHKVHERPNTAKFEKALYVMPDQKIVEEIDGNHNLFGLFVTPVGAYGEDFAVNMLRTTQILTRLADQNLRSISKEIYGKNQRLIRWETARAQDSKPVHGVAPLSTFIEGVLTFHQLVNLMLAEKIPGIDNANDALKHFVYGAGGGGLTSNITARIPLGVTGPMTLTGFGFKRAFQLNSDGKLELTAEMKVALDQMMAAVVKDNKVRRTCPMAFLFRGGGKQPGVTADTRFAKLTGLQILAEMYLKVFQMVAEESASDSKKLAGD